MTLHYARAPITEAVIDLRVEPHADVGSVDFSQIADKLPSYTKRAPITGLQMGFVGGGDNELKPHFKQESVGLRMETMTSSRVLQLQKGVFTFSHLPPYSSWKEFSAEAAHMWSLYVDAVKIRSVTRLAVRVINKLQIPAPLTELGKYSNILPHLPDKMPTAADTFFMQFQMPLPHIADKCRGIINVASSSSNDKSTSELMLDFDLYVESIMSSATSVVFPMLDKLSEGKNVLFESCITDSTRELIK